MNDDPIRVAIDARPLSGPPCGYTVYICSVIRCLKKANFDLTLFSNGQILSCYDDADGLPTKIFGEGKHVSWEQIVLPRILAESNCEIYFAGANSGIPINKNRRILYILGLLDVIPYKFYRKYIFPKMRFWIMRPSSSAETVSQIISAVRADCILTISDQSAADIRKIFRRRDVRVCLISLRKIRIMRPVPPQAQFCYIGGTDHRKKVDVLIRSFALFVRKHPEFKLLLIGPDYSRVIPLIASLGLNDRIIVTGHVDEDTKFRILGESLALVYPSLYEGYGLAIAEGFQARIPVIAGTGGSQDQIGGPGTRHIDPQSAEDIEAAMEEMLNPAVRQSWIEKGQAQLKVLTDPAIEACLIDYFTEQGQLARAKSASSR